MGLQSRDRPTWYFVPRFDDFVPTNYELFTFVDPKNLVNKVGSLKLLRTLTKVGKKSLNEVWTKSKHQLFLWLLAILIERLIYLNITSVPIRSYIK